LDRSRANLQSQKRLLEFNAQRLNSVSEVRAVDVALAKAEIEEAQAELAHARAEFEQAEIRAPQAGQILKIQTRAGESAAGQPVLQLANTRSMMVIAEVYETDLARVGRGQKAEINGAIVGKLTGKVERIGGRVERNELAPIDPSAYSNLRVVEARIRLDEQPKVPLVYAQVEVRILP
jgi:HlyD family secretion protein